ncbi:uncharacterized protein LOC120791522 isoform X2 [Xiphias gladius]|uniref:uncharacterized protein LOC120791522 isoform X2 n=1 Tax=Xiphias gladius TaxID=8245 RepID=UPI001A985DC9|nr:uncharacterized protein LOC120791522 isoform X2 [Xiphias gladius]
MMISVHFAVLFFWMTQDFVSCVNMKIPTDFLTVALGESLTLNCTYNCSTGFVRGCWSKASDNSGCHGIFSKGSFCTISLHLSNVSAEDLKKSYTCYTQDTDDPQLPQKTERIVLLQLEAQTKAPNLTDTPKTETKTETSSLPAKPKDSSGGEFTGIKILATVTVAVAMVLAALAAYLCLNRSRQSWHGESVVSRSGSPLPYHAVLSPVKGSLSTQSERVTLRIPTPDNESDTEVPYADIMITVRGVSTPELTQVGYSTSGDQKEWWGDESRSHLQASRSADRLHVPLPREVSRKMSTNSEYAVITYA